MNHLLFFSGKDCSHCDAMRLLLARLNYELGITVDEREVWENEGNYRMLENATREHKCPGLPVFVNNQTGAVLCGEVSYAQLKSWAEGEPVIQ